ncbi:hypothetical protein CFOL_v3_19449, partial [Cephalotus follicularis]
LLLSNQLSNFSLSNPNFLYSDQTISRANLFASNQTSYATLRNKILRGSLSLSLPPPWLSLHLSLTKSALLLRGHSMLFLQIVVDHSIAISIVNKILRDRTATLAHSC